MKFGAFWAFIICKAVNSYGIPFFYKMFEGRIFECCHHTLSFSLLISLFPYYCKIFFEVYIFHLQTWKAFFFHLPDSKFLLAAKLSLCQIVNYYSISNTVLRWAKDKVFAAATPHVELLHFSVQGKVLWVKAFSLFYFKTCSDSAITFRLWLNVL